ncbi:hypothetical protein [Methanoculleus sp.]|uniref:hypothetical protein n=1 Tax=Methanoculleus sp. TaxID=90427 RepID=UPI0025E6CFF1|nr:hypothetical protein [Methanoculleus sp.]MCK9318393.1 hypothetical protein [Methanoculleus sp.]
MAGMRDKLIHAYFGINTVEWRRRPAGSDRSVGPLQYVGDRPLLKPLPGGGFARTHKPVLLEHPYGAGEEAIPPLPTSIRPPSAGSSRTQYQEMKSGSAFPAAIRMNSVMVASSRSGGGHEPGTAASRRRASSRRSLRSAFRISSVAGIRSRRPVWMRRGFIGVAPG